MQNRV